MDITEGKADGRCKKVKTITKMNERMAEDKGADEQNGMASWAATLAWCAKVRRLGDDKNA